MSEGEIQKKVTCARTGVKKNKINIYKNIPVIIARTIVVCGLITGGDKSTQKLKNAESQLLYFIYVYLHYYVRVHNSRCARVRLLLLLLSS